MLSEEYLLSNPNFSGVWQLNLEKSTLRGERPSRTLMDIEHSESNLVQRVLVTRTDGTEDFGVFHYDTQAETANRLGGVTVRCRAHWEGPELAIESWLKLPDRELHFVDCWALSADGTTLTMVHRDDPLAGQISTLEKAPLEAAAYFQDRDR